MSKVKISILAPVAPIVIWVIYTFLGAGLAYGIEKNSPILDSAQNLTGCLTNEGYMTYLFYVCSLHTTIGYGTQYCCSAFGRAFSVVFILLGVPITVVTLSTMGSMLHTGITGLYRVIIKLCKTVGRQFDRLKRRDGTMTDLKFHNRNDKNKYGTLSEVNAWTTYMHKTSAHSKFSTDGPTVRRDPEQPSVPISFGVLLFCGWIVASSQYFGALDKWNFGDALYFTIISVTTVGLGDLVPSDYDMTAVIYLFIMVALILVSLLIWMVQEKIEIFISKIKRKIMDDYKKRLITEPGLSSC